MRAYMLKVMGPWCICEYNNISRIVGPANLLITHISPEHAAKLPEGVEWTTKSVAELNLKVVTCVCWRGSAVWYGVVECGLVAHE